MFNGKIHYIWSFSIAMLNYQRVKVFYVCLLFWGMRSSINWGNDGFRMVLHVDLETHYQSLSIWGGFFPCRMGIAYQYDLRGPTNSRTNIIPSFDEVKSFLSAASVNAPTDALVLMLYSGMAQADRRRYIYIYIRQRYFVHFRLWMVCKVECHQQCWRVWGGYHIVKGYQQQDSCLQRKDV